MFNHSMMFNVVNNNISNFYPHVSDCIVRNSMRYENPLEMTEVQIPIRACVLFADISGFSTLAETLANNNNKLLAAERLSEYMEQSLDIIIKQIYDRGGDVIKFAGII